MRSALDAPGDARYADVVTEQGQKARGLYFNGPMIKALGVQGVIRRLKSAKLNAAVIDLKDGQGRITFDTEIEILEPQETVFVPEASSFVAAVRDAGIYAIARIVCFSDPALPRKHPELAVLDARPYREGELWAKSKHRNTWLDPYNPVNQELIVKLAKEAEELGFDEIQLDYFRFPVDGTTRYAKFPSESAVPRAQVLLGILRSIDEAIRIPIGVDVFGVTAFRWEKEKHPELGQVLVHWAAHVDVYSPMLYVNGMSAWMRDRERKRAQRLIRVGVRRLREHLGPRPVIRPFLQAFPRGADYFNTDFIVEQVLGARKGGADGFLFWHPGSRYGIVSRAMRGRIRDLVPFSIEERMALRAGSYAPVTVP